MSDDKTYDEIMAEREQYPLGKPKPYKEGHVNYLRDPPADPRDQWEEVMSRRGRTYVIVFAAILIGYGGYGLLVDDLFLPFKHAPGVHYHGPGAFLIFCMFASFGTSCVVGAFGRRSARFPKGTHHRLARLLFAGGVIFMLAGVAVH